MSTNQHTIPAANVASLLATVLNEHSLRFNTRQTIAQFVKEHGLDLSGSDGNANLHSFSAYAIAYMIAVLLNEHTLRRNTRELLLKFVCDHGISISEAVED